MKSVFAINQSGVTRTLGGRAKRSLALGLSAVALAGAFAAAPVQAQGTKIGFVNTERILRDSGPAKTAQARIESEFKKRDDELQRLASNLRTQAEKFDKDAPVMSESNRIQRQRELANMDTELQRKRREFQEDFNRRRNEEFTAIVERANGAIKALAEKQNYDLIVQDAVTVNPNIDITDQVIQALGK